MRKKNTYFSNSVLFCTRFPCIQKVGLYSLLAGVICERLGRKLMLHSLSLLSVGLWLMISQAWNIYTIVSARVLLGFISSTSSSASKSVPQEASEIWIIMIFLFERQVHCMQQRLLNQISVVVWEIASALALLQALQWPCSWVPFSHGGLFLQFVVYPKSQVCSINAIF